MAQKDHDHLVAMTGRLLNHGSSSSFIANTESTSTYDGINTKRGGSESCTHLAESPRRDRMSQVTVSASGTGFQLAQDGHKRQYFRSRRLRPDEKLQQPWTEPRDPREKWVLIIPLIGLFADFLIAAYLIIQGLLSVKHHNYKLVLDENWETFDGEIWTKESNVGGFG